MVDRKYYGNFYRLYTFYYRTDGNIRDSSYSWRRPYSDYEQQVITTKWIGLVLLIGGGIWLGIRIYQYVYVNKHTQDLNEIAKLGGIAKCQTCGLTVTQNLTFCPRCGSAIPKRPAEFTNIKN